MDILVIRKDDEEVTQEVLLHTEFCDLSEDIVFSLIAKDWNVDTEELDREQFIVMFSENKRTAFVTLEDECWVYTVVEM